MSKHGWRAALAAVVLGVSGLALAQTSGNNQNQNNQNKGYLEKKNDAMRSHFRTITLTVKEVNADQHKVQFEAQVSPEANIEESGNTIKLDQLKEGDQVRASFDPKTQSVVKLEVIPAGSATTPMEK